MAKSIKLKTLAKRVIKKARKVKAYQYWLAAILLHLIFILIFGSRLMFPGVTREILFKGRVETGPREIAPKRIERKEKRVITEVPAHIKKVPRVKKRIMVKKPVKAREFTRMAKVKPREVKLVERKRVEAKRIVAEKRAERRRTWRKFAKQFKVSGRGKQVKAVFTPVLARYRGGDWNKDPTALPNLMREMKRRSNVKANEVPKVVSVSSKEIFKCPFVYFTGTKDFRLTEEEVKNLRLYLMQGGLVWADNGLPGRRSRFDLAFRREMKRVLPDRRFETIRSTNGFTTHPIFTSFYKLKGVPTGMNWRDDPIEIVKIDRRVVIIYTLNDYGDFWETRFNSNGNVDNSLDENWQHIWGPHWQHNISGGSYIKYENLNQESVDDAYKLGINIIAYLLTR